MKKAKFGLEHVGQKVMYLGQGTGEIIEYENGGAFPVVVKLGAKGGTYCFSETGQVIDGDGTAILFFGTEIEFRVKGEKIPEILPVCPICNEVHKAVKATSTLPPPQDHWTPESSDVWLMRSNGMHLFCVFNELKRSTREEIVELYRMMCEESGTDRPR